MLGPGSQWAAPPVRGSQGWWPGVRGSRGVDSSGQVWGGFTGDTAFVAVAGAFPLPCLSCPRALAPAELLALHCCRHPATWARTSSTPGTVPRARQSDARRSPRCCLWVEPGRSQQPPNAGCRLCSSSPSCHDTLIGIAPTVTLGPRGLNLEVDTCSWRLHVPGAGPAWPRRAGSCAPVQSLLLSITGAAPQCWAGPAC